MLNLYPDLVKEYGISEIYTSHLNQDLVENLFSILRALGGTDYRFGALSYIWRLRLVILGAGKDLKILKSNVLQSSDEKLITEDITKDLIDGLYFPDVIQTVEDEINNEDVLQMTDFDVDSANIPVLVMSVPDDEFMEQDLDEDSDDEDDEDQKTTKRKSSGNVVRFDEEEIFDPQVWLSKRKITSTDTLVNDLKTWNSEFTKYHSTASDGAYSILRTPNVIKNFFQILKSLNPNKHSDKILKEFSRDRTFQRLAHMKNILKKDRTETARSKKLKQDLQE